MASIEREIVRRGEKVSLVVMTNDDQSAFHAWLQSPELRQLIDDHRVPTMEDQMRWFDRARQPDRRFFSILTTEQHQLIGNCGFVEIDRRKRSAILRITIGDPAFIGSGYGSEAVRLLVDIGWHDERFQTVSLLVLPTNVRAMRSYEKAGFRILGEETCDGRARVRMTIDRSE